jgi:signal recognition particle subunit SRP54
MAQLKKMAGGGGLMGLVEMIPGVGRAMKEARQAGENLDEKQFKRIEAIIQSMTAEERRRPEILGGSRRRRIAAGSGTTAADVNQLLSQFRQMQAMMKQLGRGGLPGMGPGMKLPSLGGVGGLPALPNGVPSATAGTGSRHPKKDRKKKKKRR